MASGHHIRTEVSKFILYTLHGLTHSNVNTSMRLIHIRYYPYTFLSLYFYPVTLGEKKSLSTKWLGSLPKSHS